MYWEHLIASLFFHLSSSIHFSLQYKIYISKNGKKEEKHCSAYYDYWKKQDSDFILADIKFIKVTLVA